MMIGVNQFSFPMTYDVADAVRAAKRLGFDSIELCLTAAEDAAGGGVTDALDIGAYHNRLLNTRGSGNDLRELKRIVEGEGIRVSSIGGIVTFTIFPLTSRNDAIVEKARDAVKRMQDAARDLGADTVLLIPGLLTPDMPYEESYLLAQSRVAELAELAPDICLAVENVWNNMLYSPLEINRFVDGTGKPNVGVYFDIANARRFGSPEQWIRTFGKRIRKLHCKDYRMSIDNINAFTNVLDGDVNYPEVLRALRAVGYDGDLVVELVPPAHYLVENTLLYAKESLKTLIMQSRGGEQS